MIDKFEQFVKKHTESIKKEEIDLKKEKETWLNNLEKLFSLVKKSLNGYIEQEKIKLIFSETTLTEESLGSYKVPEIQIIIGAQSVHLKPIGTFFFGSRGKVDMIGPRGRKTFTIVPPNSKGFAFQIRTQHPGQTPQADNQTPPVDSWVWKIETPPPHVVYVELTENSFREALMEVASS